MNSEYNTTFRGRESVLVISLDGKRSMETRAQSQVRQYRIYVGQSGTKIWFYPNAFVVSRQCYCTFFHMFNFIYFRYQVFLVTDSANKWHRVNTFFALADSELCSDLVTECTPAVVLTVSPRSDLLTCYAFGYIKMAMTENERENVLCFCAQFGRNYVNISRTIAFSNKASYDKPHI